MPKLRTLGGEEVIKIFTAFGFLVGGQRGSHVKLKRVIDSKINQTLTIPNHKELDRGTLKAIYNQALKYISETDLRGYFYSD